MITEEVRAETMAKLTKAEATFAVELELVSCLDGHWIVQTGNLSFYRSVVHCSCAAEWWSGGHEGDPSFEAMWDIHRAEVVSAFLADRKSAGDPE